VYSIILSLKNLYSRVRSAKAVYTLRIRGARVGKGVTIGKRVRFDLGARASLEIGDRVIIDTGCFITVAEDSDLTIGNDTYIFHNSDISSTAGTTIGKFCSLAPYVSVIDSDHNYDDTHRPIRFQGGTRKRIVIEDEVWIGTRAVVLSGVHLGKHSVIAAGSVVTQDVPSNSLAGGVPARILRQFG
jgi:acetyltransferase-like isoleucine patch superfamily enzyme